MSFQRRGEVLVRFRLVAVGAVWIEGHQTLIALAPVILVFALVVVARLRNAHLEETGEAEHRSSRRESPARVAPDPGALDIDPGKAPRELLHSGNLIGNRVVTPHRSVIRVLKRFGPAGRPHSVDRD